MAVLTRALGMLDQALAAKRQGRRLGVYDPSEPALHRSGDLSHGAARSDPDHRRFRDIVRGKIKQNLKKYISQRRADRPQGQGPRLHPPAADRHPALPLRRQAAGRRRAGRTGRSGDAGRQGRARSGGRGQGGDRTPASTRSRSSCRSTSWPRSWARSWSCRASSPRAKSASSPRRTATSASAAPAPSRCATSSAPSARRCGGRSRPAPTTRSNPIIVPVREDRRYRSWKTSPLPQSNAVIIYMMDVSGSMGDEQKEIVRIEVLLDRHLAALAVQGPRDALHHPRRRGARGRPRHLLPHARVGRHDDLERVQAVRAR